MIATFGDLDIGIVARGGQHARRKVVIEIGPRRARREDLAFAGGHDPLDIVGAQHGVHLRDLRPDVVTEALHQAAGDNQPARLAIALEARHLENGIHRFLLGGIDEAASVDDDDVGVAEGCAVNWCPRALQEGPS